MLLFGLHLILQNITAMFLYNCTLPVLRSLHFSAGNSISPPSPSFQKNNNNKKKSSLEGILNKASAPVLSGGRGGFAPVWRRTARSDVPAGMRVLHKLCPGCLIYSCHFCLCRYKPAMLKSDTFKLNQTLRFLLRLLRSFFLSF